MIAPLDAALLPPGVRARILPDVNGLAVHLLEAGFAAPARPLLLLLHGFPELAYSWRKVLVPLAEAGFHVVAPDLRGYGRTTGWDGRYDGDVASFGMLNYVRDALALVRALGHDQAAAVIGHDYGSPVAAWASLVRPDVFRSAVLMSAPFGGPPALQVGRQPPTPDIHADLAALSPPRRHYQWYFAARGTGDELMRCRQGVRGFLRAYYHHKSADWPGNRPFPLTGWTATELAKLPTYYVMDAGRDMAETVAAEMPPPAAIAGNRWLPDAELAVYAAEYARTGFQGGLNVYRCLTTEAVHNAMLEVFDGRAVTVPSCFIAGAADWGTYQRPGHFERMQDAACTDFRGAHLVEGAGHWVQQEQPDAVVRLVLDFLREVRPGGRRMGCGLRAP